LALGLLVQQIHWNVSDFWTGHDSPSVVDVKLGSITFVAGCQLISIKLLT
jgi:hypothetical protein